METNRLVTIGALSERTEVIIDTIRYYKRICILPKPPRSVGGIGSTPKNISGTWSSSDGHANWVSPLRTCARFFGSREIGKWHVGRRRASPKSTLLTSVGRLMN